MHGTGVEQNAPEVIGNLGKDPEMRYTQSGQAVTSFSVACNRKHEMDERCARWLLMAHDRVGADDGAIERIEGAPATGDHAGGRQDRDA